MKKSLLTAALISVLATGLTGCKDDTQPRLGAPEPGSFKLYEPAMNNYTYYLTPDGVMTLTTNGQPDYGVATPTQYQVQVALTPDPEGWHEEVIDPETEAVLENATVVNLSTVDTQSVITLKMSDIAIAMNTMMGIHSDDDEGLFNPNPVPLYCRVIAYVADPKAEDGYVPYSRIESNVMKINSVQPYFVVPKPGELFLIGDISGWNIAATDYVLTEEENGIGSKIYTGEWVFTTAQANAGFRFYTVLGDWESNSVGYQVDDAGTTFSYEDDFSNGVFSTPCVMGKGNWCISGWPENHKMKITVNLNNMSVSFQDMGE